MTLCRIVYFENEKRIHIHTKKHRGVGNYTFNHWLIIIDVLLDNHEEREQGNDGEMLARRNVSEKKSTITHYLVVFRVFCFQLRSL